MARNGEHRLTARDADSGLSMVVTSGVWSGETAPSQEWTALHVLVANLGDEPVLLAPGDFELRDPRGFGYEMYDLGAVFEPAGDSRDTADSYSRDYHRGYDPGGPVEFSPIVPPGDTAKHALPWGVLEPGTQMRGFLFFRSMERHANEATLTWHALRPDYTRVADLRFDLHVAVPRRSR